MCLKTLKLFNYDGHYVVLVIIIRWYSTAPPWRPVSTYIMQQRAT